MDRKNQAAETKSEPARVRGKGRQRGAWCDDFLARFAELGDMAQAQKLSGIGRTAFWQYRKDDEEFDAAVEEVAQTWIDRLAAGSFRRALVGTRKVRHRPKSRKTTKGKGGTETVEIDYAEHEEREFSFAREQWWLSKARPEEFGNEEAGHATAIEFAQRIHEALAAIDGCMDEDAPDDEDGGPWSE